MINLGCTAEPCQMLLNSTCVFYTGANLLYIGAVTNDNLQTILEKIDLKFKDASVGYVFQNGITQTSPGNPVTLGGILSDDVYITSGPFNFTVTGDLTSGAHVTIGGTSSQFVKGDGSLDGTSYQHSGNYITSIIGDATATGPGVAGLVLKTVNFTTGTFGNTTDVPIITVNGKGLVTNVTTTPISVPSDVLTFTGDVTGNGFTGSITTLDLININLNTYSTDTILKFSVNSKGLITSASPITGLELETVLGYTPVPNSRNLTINGITYNLAADRTWTIPILPDQTGNAGKYLQTNGSVESWEIVPQVTLTNGSGIDITGGYPNFTITNTAQPSANTVTGTGTPNYLTKWSATPSVLDSSIIYDDGSGVMIGDTNYYNYKFDVNGSARVKTNLVVGPQNSILADTNVGIRVNTPMTLVGSTISGSSAFGIQALGEIRSDITTRAAYFNSNSNTAATSFTLQHLNHYYASQQSIGAGSIVTNQYGFFAESNIAGATNNYGFYGAIVSGTGRWNLYMDGTASNYINGTTYIGINTDDSTGAKLQVRGGITSTISGSTTPVALTAINNSTSAILTQIGLNTTAQVIFQNAGNPTSRVQMKMFSSGVENVRLDPLSNGLNFFSGYVVVGATSTGGDTVNRLQVSGSVIASQYRLSALSTNPPATVSSPGTLGEIRIDANYIYICVGTNSWKRAQLSIW